MRPVRPIRWPGSSVVPLSTGNSQSGNFIKTFIHLGFNEDLSGRMVWDGVFPRIAARQTPINYRFAQPGGAGRLYEPGSEPVVWWGRYEDTTRNRAPASMLDRCMVSTDTCPKVIEAFTAAEFWGLRMSPGMIGTDARSDIRAAGQRAALLPPGHDPWRWARRVQPRVRTGPALRAPRQPQSRPRRPCGLSTRR